ncbi:SUMF1/EgtB/PvdO family nonheme iron enzyme, partial [Neisseria gonorrhoeae]
MKYVRLFFLGTALAGTQAAAAEMVQIEGGSYRPLYLKKDTGLIKVKPFKLDKYPVTNAEFAEFVNSHPQWQKGRIGSKQAEPA